MKINKKKKIHKIENLTMGNFPEFHRLTSIYSEVHKFSQLDTDNQLLHLKNHLFSVRGKRRSNFQFMEEALQNPP